MDEFYWIAVAVVTVVSSSRITRLLTWDKFPPIKAVRDWYGNKTDGSGWDILAYCGYCMSFWVTLAIIEWGWLAGVFDNTSRGSDTATHIWWYTNAIFAASYLAAILMANDGDEGDD